MADIAQKEIAAIRTNNIDLAYSYTATGFQKNVSVSDYKNFLDHYPQIKNSTTVSFMDRQRDNDIGKLKGTLKASDGTETAIMVTVIKESGEWKIYSIDIYPGKKEVPSTDSNEPTNDKVSDTTSNPESINLSNTFDNKNSKFAIQYPANWEYETPDKFTTILGGKKDTPEFYTMVNIQLVLTKKNGGVNESAKQQINDFKQQFQQAASNINFISEEDFTLTTKNNQTLKGTVLTTTYSYHDKNYKQMQYVLMTEDGKYFYTYAFTALADRFEKDLPTSQAMMHSLTTTAPSSD